LPRFFFLFESVRPRDRVFPPSFLREAPLASRALLPFGTRLAPVFYRFSFIPDFCDSFLSRKAPDRILTNTPSPCCTVHRFFFSDLADVLIVFSFCITTPRCGPRGFFLVPSAVKFDSVFLWIVAFFALPDEAHLPVAVALCFLCPFFCWRLFSLVTATMASSFFYARSSFFLR